jgi:hypothetical protein
MHGRVGNKKINERVGDDRSRVLGIRSRPHEIRNCDYEWLIEIATRIIVERGNKLDSPD